MLEQLHKVCIKYRTLVVFYSQNKVESDHSRQSSSTYSHKTTTVISNGKGK